MTFQKWPLVAEVKLKTWKMTSIQICNLTSTNRCYFKNVTALVTSREHWAKWLFVRFWKDCLLAELQAKMPRGCRFSLFCHHSCEVTLRLLMAAKNHFPLISLTVSTLTAEKLSMGSPQDHLKYKEKINAICNASLAH